MLNTDFQQNRRVPVFCNIRPVIWKGVHSHGAVLTARDVLGRAELLLLNPKAPIGSRLELDHEMAMPLDAETVADRGIYNLVMKVRDQSLYALPAFRRLFREIKFWTK